MGKVTKKKLRKYGWVDSPTLGAIMRHPNFENTHMFYSWNLYHPSVTCEGEYLKKCPTMKQLKAYVLKHTGEKMKKVKNAKKNKLPNTLKDQSENGKEQEPVELPKRWEDIKLDRAVKHEFVTDDSEIGTFYGASVDSQTYKNILPLGLAAPMLATCQLLLLRDVYRQGWKPDWSDKIEIKYGIYKKEDKILVSTLSNFVSIWSFQDAQTRDLFLENFEPLLQEHYKLYN